MNVQRLAAPAVVVLAVALAAGCAADPSINWQREVVGNSYIDQTHNCRVSAPNANWKIEMIAEDFGSGCHILQMSRSVYDAAVTMTVTNVPVKNLETFARVQLSNVRETRLTYLSGIPCFYAVKVVTPSPGMEFTVFLYCFVHDNVGYLMSAAYPSRWGTDETLMGELDEVFNSFEFISGPLAAVATGGAVRGSPEGKLVHVAVLDIVDLGTGAPSQTTRTLTDELQNQCMKSGHFELLDRRQLDAVLGEHDLKAAAITSGQSAIDAGKLLGARYLMTGNLGHVGESSVIYLQVCDAETGQIIRTASIRCRGSQDRLLDAIPSLVMRLSAAR